MPHTPETVADRVARLTADYANLALFHAFHEDRIPVERFPDFFHEQYMTARWFQDLIWATTEIPSGPYAAFAREHRRRDSGHHRWMQHDLEAFGLEPMTADDWFRLEWLPTRMQMARILARCADAEAEDRLVILAALESAGAVTLGTLHDYVVRHGLPSLYLGPAHVRVEEQQVDEIHEIAAEVMASQDPHLLETVDVVFDALTTMFSEGGRRIYGDLIAPVGAAT